MDSTRRGFLRFIGIAAAAPAAAPLVAPAVGSPLASLGLGAASTMLPPSALPPLIDEGVMLGSNAVANKAKKLMSGRTARALGLQPPQVLLDEWWREAKHEAFSQVNLDPDIAGWRWMSPVMKRHTQILRNYEETKRQHWAGYPRTSSILDKIAKAAGYDGFRSYWDGDGEDDD